MTKDTLRFIFYLLVAISLGVVVSLITSNLDNFAEEKRLKKTIESEVRSAVSSFRDSAPAANDDDAMRFLKLFAASAGKDKILVVEHGVDKRPEGKDYRPLFKFASGVKKADVFINESYVHEEVTSVDVSDFIPGVVTTVLVFFFIVFFTGKREQTQRMQTELAIKHAELNKALKEHEALALLGRMSATLAHELKTPIATISNLIQALPSRIGDEAFLKKTAVMAGEELIRTHQLIDNLLIYGKDITATTDERIDFKPFIEDIALRHGMEITACPSFTLEGDRFYLNLLFENLIRNSIQAGATTALIKISEEPGGERALICIEDNGHGFKKGADLDELLIPFVTMRSKGAGLGLYLAQKIAAAHHGSVSLYRAGAGAGVKITLPKKRVEAREHAEA